MPIIILKYLLTFLVVILFVVATWVYGKFKPTTFPNLDHMQNIWNQHHYVELKHATDKSKDVIVSKDGFSIGTQPHISWRSLMELAGNHHAVLLTVHEKVPQGIKKSRLVISASGLDLSADELFELFRLAYNHWIDSLNQEEQEIFFQELKDAGY